jgi:hypothetical protein
MPIYTFHSALETMKANDAIETICYKIVSHDENTCSYLIERKENYFWHCCELSGPSLPEPFQLWKRIVYTRPTFRGDIVEPLPPPSSPLERQVATGYVSPVATAQMTITIPKSTDTSPVSGCLAPRAELLSPLALSRQTSLEEITGVQQNTHLFFDEDGNEIPEDENTFHLQVEISPSGECRSFRHPRTLLFYLRYIADTNELGDNVPWPRLTENQRTILHTYISRHPPPPEFEEDVKELFALMKCCPM